MIQKHPQRKSSQKGFTLVELSIVLVIIGLIVGGVLAGQTLIVAAKIRAQMTQLDQFDAGINAFRGKYDCLPGDCTAAQVPAGANQGAPTNGGALGDGTIDYAAAATAADESTVSWNQMQVAGVVGGSFAPAVAGANYTGALPQAKAGGFVVLGGTGGTHFYIVGGVGAVSPVPFTTAISANTAAAIDKKRDDGLPVTGVVTSITPAATNPFTAAVLFKTASGTPANDCNTVTAGTEAYQSGLDTAKCLMKIRISG